uniref:Large ribosomal subunit protein uL11m n=1 Tax=Biomphalaria glabrata TaxID=6526 RepID=A0A2C9LTK5_BIOGL
MKIVDSAIEFLKTIPGVRGFILSSNGNPAPLSKLDFEKISSSAKEKIEKFDKEIRYEVGQTVKITDGPFASFVGEVEHVDYSKQRLRVAVAIFGQSTPVDLELSQIVANLKFNIKAGLASAAPPVGPVLGQKGVNIMDFCKTFNGMTQSYDKSYLMRALVAVYEDKTYTCEIRLPSVSWFIKHFLSIEKGSSKPGTNVVKKIKISDLDEIAKIKMDDMGVFSHEAARSMVVGTAKIYGHRSY